MSAELLPFPDEMFVYVIGASDGPQKIGMSRNPASRCATLRVDQMHSLSRANGSLVVHGTVPVPVSRARDIERYAHWLLRAKRCRGEWFDVSPAKALATINKAAVAVHHGKTAPKQPRHPGATPIVALRLSKRVYDALKVAAAEDGRSLSNLIRRILKAHMKEKGYLQ
jgi:hypothetical protein